MNMNPIHMVRIKIFFNYNILLWMLILATSTSWSCYALIEDSNSTKLSFTDLPRLLQNNDEVKSLQMNEEAQASWVRASKASYLPSLDLVGSWQDDNSLKDDVSGNSVYLQGSWNLYRGGKDQAVIAVSKKNQDIAKISNRITYQNILMQAENFFLDLWLAQKKLDIFQAELSISQTQKSMAQKKVQTGLTSHVDLLEFELRINYINMQINILTTQKSNSEKKLKKILKLADTEKINIDYKFTPQAPSALDITQTLLYQKQVLAEEKTKEEKNIYQADFYPRIDLQTKYGTYSPQHYSTFSMNHLDDEKSVALVLTIPIFEGFKTSYEAQAKNQELHAVMSNNKQSLENLQSELDALNQEWVENNELLKLNQQRIQLAQKYYDLTIVDYNRGIKNSPDVVAATEHFFEAQRMDVEIQSKLALISARIKGSFSN